MGHEEGFPAAVDGDEAEGNTIDTRYGEFDAKVVGALRRQALRLRVGRLVCGVAALSFVVLIALAIQLSADWLLRLPRDMRAVLLVVVVAIAALALRRFVIAPLRLRFGVREMAQAVERSEPKLDALLISAIDFRAGRTGPRASSAAGLVDRVIASATEAARTMDFDTIVAKAPVRRASIRLIVCLAAVVVAFGFMPQTLGVWFDRNVLLRNVEWPKRTRIVVDAGRDGIIRGAVGDDLQVRARIDEGYVVPRVVEIVYETESGKSGRETMTGVGERGLRSVFPRQREALRFYIEGGDDTTDWYEVQLTERPSIETATLTVEAPAYTRIGTLVLPPDRRSVEMYTGSSLAIRALCTKPIAEAILMAARERAADVAVDGSQLVATVTPQTSQTYHFELVDLDGLADSRPVRFSARLLEDEPPRVRLQLPGAGNMVTQEAVVPIEAEFTDQLGLAEAKVMYRLSTEEAELAAVPLDGFAPYETHFEARRVWAIAQTGAQVGDQVSVFAQASDFNDVTGPGVGESTAITFRIVTPEELLAEFNRREQEYRRQFERLVENQERLRRDLLTAVGRFDELGDASVREVTLAPLERRQRQIGAQVNIIRGQFEQVLREMAVNRLDTTEARERVGEQIIAPLTELGSRDLVDSADLLRRLAREGTEGLAQRVDPVQAQLVVRMRAVLDNMLQWEGYQETVTMLREIIRLQRELNAETREEIDRQGSDIFDD